MIQKNVFDFKLEKSKEKITARSGLAVFSEFAHALGVPHLIDCSMPKALSNRGFNAWSYVHAFLLTLYGGGEEIAATREIRHDKTLRELCGIDIVPSESASGDWLKRMGARGGIEALKRINKELLTEVLKKNKITKVIITNDPTLIKAEKRDAHMTYEGYKGYRPMMVIIQELGLIAHYEFRHGNDNGRRLKFFEEIFDILPPEIKIELVLMDAEFYEGPIFSLLMKKKTDFAIAVSKDDAVLETIEQISGTSWKQCEDQDGVRLDKEFSETVHVMNTCPTPFRLVVLRWKNPKDHSSYCYHAIATNMEKDATQGIIWKYNSRSGDENHIKELKNGFGMRKMPSGDFEANAVYFGIGVLCHNLFIAQKILTMPRSFHHTTIKTVRWFLLEVPGKIVTKASKVVLRIATHTKKFEIFKQMRRKNHELSVA
ncbi:IS1380 family transposase [Patescibacteria group bacterium]|nr:IS1380 family transposase [Patescibacteria group bacterium]